MTPLDDRIRIEVRNVLKPGDKRPMPVGRTSQRRDRNLRVGARVNTRRDPLPQTDFPIETLNNPGV